MKNYLLLTLLLLSTIGLSQKIPTTNDITEYEIVDRTYLPVINYYRLTQFDFNGESETFDIVSINNNIDRSKPVKIINHIGQLVSENTKGIVFEIYDDGSIVKKYK